MSLVLIFLFLPVGRWNYGLERISEEHSSTGLVFFKRTLPPKIVGPDRLDLAEELDTFDLASSLDRYLEASRLFLNSDLIFRELALFSGLRVSEKCLLILF